MKAKLKVAVIGGGLSATTFLRYLFSNREKGSFSISLFESGQVELIDHIRNLDGRPRPRRSCPRRLRR